MELWVRMNRKWSVEVNQSHMAQLDDFLLLFMLLFLHLSLQLNLFLPECSPDRLAECEML